MLKKIISFITDKDNNIGLTYDKTKKEVDYWINKCIEFNLNPLYLKDKINESVNESMEKNNSITLSMGQEWKNKLIESALNRLEIWK